VQFSSGVVNRAVRKTNRPVGAILRTGAAGSQDESPCRAIRKSRITEHESLLILRYTLPGVDMGAGGT
jgi:hypothetical protein